MVHVGRQPISDPAGRLVGYELLFRGHADAIDASSRGAYATSQVLTSAFTEFGFEHLVGGRLGFVNLTREFLVGELPLPFPPELAVLEVLETVTVDDEVVAGVAALAARGYAIALDDFVASSAHARLLELASYVKLDLLDTTEEHLTAAVAACRRHRHLTLVAERIETQQQLMLAHRLGFDLFQGYHLARPQVLSTVTLAPSRLHTMRLLVHLTDSDANLAHIVELVTADPALSCRLLRAANCTAAGLHRPVASVHDATVMIGTDRLRHWLTLMAVSDIAASEQHLTAVLIRARFCQHLATHTRARPDSAFTVGLLDAVCDLLDQPRPTLIADLPLTGDLTAALLHAAGPLGEILTLVRAYEQGHHPAPGRPPLAPAAVSTAYLDAVCWAQNLITARPHHAATS
jgi:EAL and modified HD-GYP domain-containing signal transduction protein